ncbi:hypothetical protein GF380_01360 [Candidatus Uhrbacteria bacterium]|nr:hypothetical protein [Candidatus Uhrbacteria bacterium]
MNVTVPNSEEEGGDEGQTSNTTIGSGAALDEDDRCGEGGVCTPISDVQLVRGVTGQCLEYDLTRVRLGDRTQNECLTWNPNPILTGPGDQYHWHPTAGFQPPQTSGRYYCSSAVREPRIEQQKPFAWLPDEIPEEGFDWKGFALSFVPFAEVPLAIKNTYEAGRDIARWGAADDIGGSGSCGDGDYDCFYPLGPMLNSAGTYMGNISAIFYADWYTSDGSCTNFVFFKGCTGNEPGASLDGKKPKGTRIGKQCEKIDDENGQGFIHNTNMMRLVTTGHGTNKSYAEYAILFNPWHTAYSALGFTPSDWETAFDFSTEDVIANFEFSTPRNKIGCAYNEEWAEGVHVDNYNKRKSKGWGDQDAKWQAYFTRQLSEGGGTLNRSTAKVVTEDGSDTGIPVKVDCLVQGESDDPVDNRGGDEGLCYIKTWELNWNAEGKQKFQAFTPDIGRNGIDHLSRRPVYGKCDTGDHWFSIRAVFEDTNPSENLRPAEEVSPDQLVGPFQFVGLWVTACAPGNETKYIYMDMKMNSADVCRELVETISKDSNDVVAYTDRNREGSIYQMDNGYGWYTANIPYGASLATGDAGIQPLFMTGVEQQNVNPLNPPVFTSPGVTYFSSTKYPTNNWGRLSNVFAKIYRIYGYYTRGVTREDWACTNRESPQFGQWCPPEADEETSKEFCGFEGKCLRGGINADDVFAQKACNVFSGVNRGLDCSGNPDLCHTAAQEERNGVLVPKLGACELFRNGYDPNESGKDAIDARWEELEVSGRYLCRGDDCPNLCRALEGPGSSSAGTDTGCTRAEAIKHGAFRCAQGTVRGPEKVEEKIGNHTTYASYCTRESERSAECPQEVSSRTCVKSAEPLAVNGTTIREIESPSESGTGYGYYYVRYKNLIPDGARNVAFDPGYNDFDGTGVEPTGAWGFEYSADLVAGTCAGHPWAQCFQDEDCHFSGRNFWPSGDVNINFLWTRGKSSNPLGQHHPRIQENFNRSNPVHSASDLRFYYDVPSSGFFEMEVDGVQINAGAFKEAFAPAVPLGLDQGGKITKCEQDEALCFYATRLTTNSESVFYKAWDDTDLLKLAPGFNAFINWTGGNSNDALTGFAWRTLTDDEGEPVAPYYGYDIGSEYDSATENMWANYGACESVALMWQEGGECGDDDTCTSGDRFGASCQVDSDCMGSGSILGTCRGGGRDGESCGVDSDCRPPQMSDSEFEENQGKAEQWCNPVTTGRQTSLADSYLAADGSDACWPSFCTPGTDYHPQREDDPALDCNICTHPPGYWPRPQWCQDPNDEYCGLFGYKLDSGSLSGSVRDERPLPTDVTQGHYLPSELNPDGAGSNEDAAVSDVANDYRYISRYVPEPPQVAAPDVRTCQGGQCRITGLGTFALDGLAGGIVNGGTGHHVTTMRFYAWAAHDQMPMRKMVIDWGDGTVSEIPDAHMKNRKPYCQTAKECTQTPGLTCETDADCPPGGGLCATWGTCSNSVTTKCFQDSQCNIGGNTGFCESRVRFGNDQDACEENYFEFKHAYSCAPDPANRPPNCADVGGTNRCSGDSDVVCNTNNDCAEGDTCVPNMAPPSISAIRQGGCFDAQNNRCLFTPRIIVYDNWGWCTGECRNDRDENNGALIDGAGSYQRHPNGGCYDASLIYDNVNFNTAIGPNECSPIREVRTEVPKPITLPTSAQSGTTNIQLNLEYFTDPTETVGTQTNVTPISARPWVTFPGAVQLLPGQEL